MSSSGSARPPAEAAPGWRHLLDASLAVFIKEVRSEVRTRYALNAVLLFAVSTIVAVSLGLGPIAPRRNPDLPLVQAALLWMAILFAAFTGLARTFIQEEDARTAAALRLAAPALAVFLGKAWFNTLLLGLLTSLSAALFLVLLRVGVADLAQFCLVLALGSAGLVAATTLIAAIIARASARGALFAVLSFPLLTPLLVVAIRATALTIEGVTWAVIGPPLQILAAYAVALFTASLLLFDVVWEA